MLRKRLIVLLFAALAVTAVGCAKKYDGAADNSTELVSQTVDNTAPEDAGSNTGAENTGSDNNAAPNASSAGRSGAGPDTAPTGYDSSKYPQLQPLKKGETLVTLSIEHKGAPMGDIVLRFFPEYAPKAVENFVTHAKNGYYDGIIFHRVYLGFMIQGGDPLGTGMGGESIWGGTFDYEITPLLRHYRGALAMAHSSVEASNGSQFYIVQNDDLGDSMKETLMQMMDQQDDVIGQDADGNDVYTRDYYPKEVLQEYMDIGGSITLDGGYTVFGQVVSGMDVVDRIANVEVDASNADSPRPIDDVIIRSVTVSEYAD